MIRSIFFPERIGSYYIFRKRIVGIEITDRSVIAVLVHLNGLKRTIEAVYEEPLSTDTDSSYDEKIVRALSALSHSLGKYDAIFYAMASSRVIFKELTLPFIGIRKIKMVIPFEAEPLLPFNLEVGVLDSIITQEHEAEKKTDLMLCAIKKESLEKVINYFVQAGLSVEKVSVDVFDLYGLYKKFAQETPVKGATALLDIGSSRTILALLVDGRLAYIRNLPQGCISNDAPQAGASFDSTMEEQLTVLLNEIHLTLELTVPKLTGLDAPENILITGMITDFKESKEFISDALRAPVEYLSAHDLVSSGIVASSLATLPGSAVVSIATAASLETTEDFTLLQAKEQHELSRTIFYQLIAAALITLTLFLSFSMYSFLRIRTLKKTYASAEKDAIAELQKQFKLPPAKTTRLETANKAAQADLKKQETAWRRISPESRYSYLKYLAALTKCINMKEAQLELTNLIIKDDTIKLYGSVPGYPQLNKLQTQLECPLFKKVSKLQDRNFKTEPITLIVNQEEL